ncbi:MAG TPA: cytochrome c [Steroidobacteraceae bacterium]
MWRDGGLRSFILGVMLALPVPAMAEDETGIVLAEGSGRDQVQASCSMCHSLDYIVMNSPFQDKAAWEKTVNKMVAVFGAPLTPEESAAIAAYLDRHYGK